VSSRIGKGPWARAFGAAFVPDESTPEAQRGAQLAGDGAVRDVAIDVGLITAEIEGCKVTLSTPRVPARIWTAMTSYARNRGALEQAVEGKSQSVQLEHLMAQDWDEPLVPAANAVLRICTCSDGGACEHVAALAYVLVEEIDRDASNLLRWRGCVPGAERTSDERVAPSPFGRNPWEGGHPAEPTGRRAVPIGGVLSRLGRSGIQVGNEDLADALEPAYAAFGSG
jgi:hypothetical protein